MMRPLFHFRDSITWIKQLYLQFEALSFYDETMVAFQGLVLHVLKLRKKQLCFCLCMSLLLKQQLKLTL